MRAQFTMIQLPKCRSIPCRNIEVLLTLCIENIKHPQ